MFSLWEFYCKQALTFCRKLCCLCLIILSGRWIRNSWAITALHKLIIVQNKKTLPCVPLQGVTISTMSCFTGLEEMILFVDWTHSSWHNTQWKTTLLRYLKQYMKQVKKKTLKTCSRCGLEYGSGSSTTLRSLLNAYFLNDIFCFLLDYIIETAHSSVRCCQQRPATVKAETLKAFSWRTFFWRSCIT